MAAIHIRGLAPGSRGRGGPLHPGPGDRIIVFSGAHYDTYYCGEDGNWPPVEHYVITSHRPVNLPPVTNGRR
jgi:hypothetical protein